MDICAVYEYPNIIQLKVIHFTYHLSCTGMHKRLQLCFSEPSCSVIVIFASFNCSDILSVMIRLNCLLCTQCVLKGYATCSGVGKIVLVSYFGMILLVLLAVLRSQRDR